VSFSEEKFLGDMNLDFTGQVAEDILRAMQNLDQPAATAFIITVNAESFDESIEFGKFGGCSFRQFVATHFSNLFLFYENQYRIAAVQTTIFLLPPFFPLLRTAC
jgi:hypothetical protein